MNHRIRIRKIVKIASAFVGVIVGAGLASGQEILQYFTSFGYVGIIGSITAAALFAYVGMILMKLGSRTRAQSHQEVIHTISGRFLGTVIDYIMTFIILGVGIVMIAESGSVLQQQFGLPAIVGTILMIVLIITPFRMKKIKKVKR